MRDWLVVIIMGLALLLLGVGLVSKIVAIVAFLYLWGVSGIALSAAAWVVLKVWVGGLGCLIAGWIIGAAIKHKI